MPPRIQLSALPKYFHSFQRRVNVNDLNYMSHLDHASIIKIIHEARVDCLKQLGLTERNIFPHQSKSAHLLINDLSAQYMNNGELFDDLFIETGFSERQKFGFRMNHRIRGFVPIGSSDFPIQNTDQPTGTTFKLIALVEVGMVAVDDFKKPVELPISFFEKLGFPRSELETHLTTTTTTKPLL